MALSISEINGKIFLEGNLNTVTSKFLIKHLKTAKPKITQMNIEKILELDLEGKQTLNKLGLMF